MNFSHVLLTMLCVITLGTFSGIASGAQANEPKPVIALIAFGTSIPEAQKSFEDIDKAFAKAFPDYEIRWAFTAQFIIDKLAKEGQTTLFQRKEPIENPEKLFKELADKGVKNLYVQSLHVVPGGEYNELIDDNTYGMKVKYGAPLLGSDKDIAKVAKVLSREFGGSDEYTIIAGHGNDHHKAHNTQLIKFNDYIKSHYKDVQLATVEGPIGTETAFAAIKESGLKKVRFVPFMIVAGDHIMNDVMGSEPDSWRSIIDLESTVTQPLGQNPDIVKIFISHLKAILPQ